MDLSGGMKVHLAYFVGTFLVSLLITFVFQSLVTLIKATLLEAIILWHLKWGSFTRSLRIAFFLNLVTATLGFAFSSFNLYWAQFSKPFFTLKSIFLWGVFIAIEGGLLSLIDRKRLAKCLVASCIMNASSYILLYLLPLMLFSLRY